MSNNPTQIFQYNGSPVTFQIGDSVMVNATQMAKPFGKLVGDWLRLKTTIEFTDALSSDMQIPISALIQVVKGGNVKQGTWMHEDVALEFARWLSPAFAIWCNKRIKELLTTGVSTVSNDDEAIAYAMNVLQKRLEKANAEKALLEERNTLLNDKLREAAPSLKYVSDVLQSPTTYTMTQIAKECDTNVQRLEKLLLRHKVMFRQSGTWMLTSKYHGQGYTKMRTHTFTRNDGTTGSTSYTVFTERGRQLIHTLMQQWNQKGGDK